MYLRKSSRTFLPRPFREPLFAMLPTRCWRTVSHGGNSDPPQLMSVTFASGLPAMSNPARNEVRTIPPSSYAAFTTALDGGEFHDRFSQLGPEEKSETEAVRVAGRIVTIRDMGKVMFVTVRSCNVLVQLVALVGPDYTLDALQTLKRTIRKGDIVGAEGTPKRTRKGELSVFVSSVRVLAPFVCRDLVCCPNQMGYMTLADTELKYRYRFLDMICDPQRVEVFRMRHRVIAALRRYFDSKKFIEVETPIFHQVAGGASAKPFITHHNANENDLFLRVAPELFLKQCIVGGMDRVYEIGKVFRNEDCDKTHYPEYTSCEFYMAYATYHELMTMTEDVLREVCRAASGGTEIDVVTRSGDCVKIDLTEQFERLPVMPTLEERIGCALPDAVDLNSMAGSAYMKTICIRHGIDLPDPMTPPKLLDKLIDHFIVQHIVEPTFVTDHPVMMCPLARQHDSQNGLSERFELFVNGVELCNAYSELNDPVEQLHRFEDQMKLRQQYGDEEAHCIDETFLKALQVGMPPTAGWGLGVDRLVALLCQAPSIRDVILFPMLKADEGSHDTKRRVRTASFFGVNQRMTMFCLSALEAELQSRGEVKGCEDLRHLRRLASSLCKGLCDQSDNASTNNESPCSAFTKLFCRLLFRRPK